MQALIDAKERGCWVQVIIDKESLSTLYIHELASAGVECSHHNLSNSAWMHHKFAVIDEFLLINGSLNWTKWAVMSNHENIMVTGS